MIQKRKVISAYLHDNFIMQFTHRTQKEVDVVTDEIFIKRLMGEVKLGSKLTRQLAAQHGICVSDLEIFQQSFLLVQKSSSKPYTISKHSPTWSFNTTFHTQKAPSSQDNLLTLRLARQNYFKKNKNMMQAQTNISLQCIPSNKSVQEQTKVTPSHVIQYEFDLKKVEQMKRSLTNSPVNIPPVRKKVKLQKTPDTSQLFFFRSKNIEPIPSDTKNKFKKIQLTNFAKTQLVKRTPSLPKQVRKEHPKANLRNLASRLQRSNQLHTSYIDQKRNSLLQDREKRFKRVEINKQILLQRSLIQKSHFIGNFVRALKTNSSFHSKDNFFRQSFTQSMPLFPPRMCLRETRSKPPKIIKGKNQLQIRKHQLREKYRQMKLDQLRREKDFRSKKIIRKQHDIMLDQAWRREQKEHNRQNLLQQRMKYKHKISSLWKNIVSY